MILEPFRQIGSLRHLAGLGLNLMAAFSAYSIFEVTQKQLAGQPTRRELAGTALGTVFATMMLTTLILLFFLR